MSSPRAPRSEVARSLAAGLLLASLVAATTLSACGSSDTSATGPADASGDVDLGDAATSDASSPADSDVSDGADDDGSGGVVQPKDGGVGFIGAYASPSIVRDGTTYHAYFAAQRINGTHYNIPHATFTADGTWTFVGEALPHLGAQAFDGPGNYPVWAPGAAQIDATHWMLYYTAQLQGTQAKKCIWRAHAASANGPFVDDYAGPIECEPASLWAIDPYLVKDAQGTWHLAARIDQPGGINTIQLRALTASADGFAPGASWIQATQNSPSSWEQPVLENAGVVRLAPPTGEPHWFVFYSGRAWSDDTYAVGYADCGPGIGGPCTKKTPNGPWLATDADAGVFGPGTPTFYTNGAGDTLMSVQAWEFSGGVSNKKNNGQIMRTYVMSIDDAYTPTATFLRVDK